MDLLDEYPSFGQLLYRYWFFGWLFRDANRGSVLQRESALRFNRTQAHWLLVYIRRWMTVSIVAALSGKALELVGCELAAAALFVWVCIAFSVIVIAVAGWLGLRWV